MRIKVVAAHSGGFPRPPELRKAIDAFENGKIGKTALRNAWEKAVKEVLNKQLEAGLDLVSGGQLLWEDIFRPFNASWEGLSLPSVGGYKRFYELNFYYREAEAELPIAWRPAVIYEAKLVNSISPRFTMITLPGPLTFAKHVKTEDERETMFELADALAREAALLEDYVDYLIIEEPELAEAEEDAVEALNIVARSVSIPVIVKIYFKKVNNYPLLLDLEVEGLGFDFRKWKVEEFEGVVEEYGYPFQILSAGVAEALDIFVDIDGGVNKVKKLLNVVEVPEIHVTHNWRLDVIPYSSVDKKLKEVAEIANRVRREI